MNVWPGHRAATTASYCGQHTTNGRLLRVIGYRRVVGTHRPLPYDKALEKSKSQRVEAVSRGRGDAFSRGLLLDDTTTVESRCSANS